MTLEELIQDLNSIRQLRGGDCPVEIDGKQIVRIKADTSTGNTIVKIIAE